MKSADIKKVLDFDGLAEAEKMTGKSYKEDKLTESIGFMGHIENGKIKREMLESLGDSTFSNTEENYLKIVKSIGFESILVEPFMNKDNIEERLHVMWHNDYSILLVFDTYTYGDDGSFAKAGEDVPPPSVNGGKFYYSWISNTDPKPNCTSSGGYEGNGDSNSTYSYLFNSDYTPHILSDELRSIEPKSDFKNWDKYRLDFDEWCVKVDSYIELNGLIKVWRGNHDCREAIKFNISELNENGSFVKQWINTPFLWLVSYMDTEDKSYDHKEITAKRISKLPEHVIKAMNIKN